MKEHIEREAILSYPIRADHCDKKNANEHFIFGIESVMEFVENLPAADVAEVRHGRWEEASDGDGVVCSECGTDFCTMIHETEKFRFCPNCGARMDKEDDHDKHPSDPV